MDLIEFMWDLVNNPEELDRYKQNPAAYLVEEAGSLSGADKHLLLHFSPSGTDQNMEATRSKAGNLQEVSTVTRFVVNPDPKAVESPASSASPEQPISLEGMHISLSSRGSVFLAERNVNPKEKKDGALCRLLPHSYLITTQDGSVFFDLRLCFVGPSNRYDAPMVLYIKTLGGEPKGHVHHLGDAQVRFYADEYLLLKPDQPVSFKLGDDSKYYPHARRLVLNPSLIDLVPGPIAPLHPE
jgi:hypothetical protein